MLPRQEFVPCFLDAKDLSMFTICGVSFFRAQLTNDSKENQYMCGYHVYFRFQGPNDVHRLQGSRSARAVPGSRQAVRQACRRRLSTPGGRSKFGGVAIRINEGRLRLPRGSKEANEF